MQYLVELSLVEWLPGGTLRLVEKLAEVAAKIVDVLPIGYSIVDIWLEGKKLKVIVNEESASLEQRALVLPAIVVTIAALVKVLWPILATIGVVIIAWKVAGIVEIIAESEWIKSATEAGFTPDQIKDMQENVRGESITDVLKWISIIGGITIVGVGGIIAFKELRKVKA